MTKQNLKKVRNRILERRGVVLEPQTRTPIEYHDAPTDFKKTTMMRLLEMRYGQRIEKLISGGTIYEAAKRLGIDATTVSKWRKRIREAGVFFGSLIAR